MGVPAPKPVRASSSREGAKKGLSFGCRRAGAPRPRRRNSAHRIHVGTGDSTMARSMARLMRGSSVLTSNSCDTYRTKGSTHVWNQVPERLPQIGEAPVYRHLVELGGEIALGRVELIGGQALVVRIRFGKAASELFDVPRRPGPLLLEPRLRAACPSERPTLGRSPPACPSPRRPRGSSSTRETCTCHSRGDRCRDRRRACRGDHLGGSWLHIYAPARPSYEA